MSDAFDPRTTPWSIHEPDFYEIDSFHDRMAFLLRYAVLAPSTRNTQPWSFRINQDDVDVFADRSRGLTVVDPQERELLMSVGAAITNFRVAAAHFSFETTVLYHQLAGESSPVATISVFETGAPDARLVELFSSIRLRHTNRERFDGEPIEPDALARLCDVLDAFPHTFHIIMPYEKERIADLVAYADRALRAQPGWREEAAAWTSHDEPESRNLLTAASSWLSHHAHGSKTKSDRALTTKASALVVVTGEDDPIALIQTGEAVERVLLTITRVGLQYSFLNQPIEVEALRDRILTVIGTPVPAQLLIRIGYAPSVETAMPRRPLEQVINH